MSDATAQTFDAAGFERALAVLESEQQAMRLSPRQRLALRLYSACIVGFLVFLIAVVAYGYRSTKPDMSTHENIVLGLLGLGGALCFGCAVISLFLNVRLFLKIVRSRIHFRRMGLADGSEALWKAHQRRRRASAGIEKAALGVSAFLLLVAVPLLGYRQWIWAASVISVAIVFLMFYVLQSGKARMDMMSARLAELTELKESMLHLADSGGAIAGARIALPDDVMRQYSWVETEQIARSREQAITESIQTKPLEYSILSSRQVREAKASLAPADRMKIEAALDALMREPKPAGVVQDAGAGLYRLPVNGTGLELLYSADDTSMQLRVVALQPSEDGSRARA